MKKILYSAMMVCGVLACTPDRDYETAYRKYVGINTTALKATAIPEDGGGKFEIDVAYGEPDPTGKKPGISVSYEITGGTYGTDYTLEGGSGAKGTIQIPEGEAGKTFGKLFIKPIADEISEADVKLTVTLTSGPEGVSVGYPYVKSVDLVIQNDDCDYEAESWAGTFAATEVYATGDPYGPYDIDLVQDAGDPNKFVFDDFWDSGITAYVVFDPNSRAVTFPTQDDGDGGTISGTGSYLQCAGTFKIDVTYVTGGKTYTWSYEFEKE